MAEIKMMKAKPVPLKVGDTGEDILAANRLASQPESYEQYRAKRAFLPETENYQPPSPMSDVPMDMLKGGVSGLTSAAEGALGAPADLADLRYTLAHYINSKLGDSDMVNSGLDTMEKYDPLNALFSSGTEDVAKGITDPLLNAMGPEAQEWGRYQPKTPWGQATNFGASMLDPTEALLPGGAAFKAVKKVF